VSTPGEPEPPADAPAVSVETRGRARVAGYRFLGPAPQPRWWQAYREHTSFEEPTLIVESDAARWRAYLGGVPSARRDSVGTVIHYSVVLAGRCTDRDAGPDAEANRSALALLAAWLGDIAAGPTDPPAAVSPAAGTAAPGAAAAGGAGPGGDAAGRHTADALDGAFTESDVDELFALAETDEAACARRAGEHVGRALAALPPLDPTEVEDTAAGEPWIGRISAPESRAAFLAWTRDLLGGEPGRAVLPNLVDRADEVDTLVDRGAPVALLVADESRALGPTPTELRPTGGHAPEPPPARTEPDPEPTGSDAAEPDRTDQDTADEDADEDADDPAPAGQGSAKKAAGPADSTTARPPTPSGGLAGTLTGVLMGVLLTILLLLLALTTVR
jgi:hypothetical protein